MALGADADGDAEGAGAGARDPARAAVANRKQDIRMRLNMMPASDR
jgi:hypothetical protein